MRYSRSLHSAAAVATVLLLAVACGDDDEESFGSATTAAPTSAAATTPTTVTLRQPTPSDTAATSSAAASTTPETNGALLLRGDGLSVVSFGDDADETIAVLTDILGPSDDDTGWISPFNQFGTCAGDSYRAVRWKSLRVELLDGAISLTGTGESEGRQFRGYHDALWHPGFDHADPPTLITTEPLGLFTADGFGLGTTVAELHALPDGTTTITDSPYTGPAAQMQTPAGNLIGYLTGIDDTATVRGIEAGSACGE